MAQYGNTNAFADGVNGSTALSAANGDQYDSFAAQTGATMQGDAAHAYHGHNVLQVTSTTTSASNTYGYNNTTIGTKTQLWLQGYYYFTSNPVANTNIARFSTGGTTNACSTVIALTSGLLRFTDQVGTVFTLTNPIPLNAWFRINAWCFSSTTVGQVELKMFADDQSTPIETKTSTATLNTSSSGTGIVDTVRWGHTNPLAVAQTFYMAEVSVNDTAYPAPAGIVAAPSNWTISKSVRLG